MFGKPFRITVVVLALGAIASVVVSAGPVLERTEPQQDRKPPLPKQENPPAFPNVRKIHAATYLECRKTYSAVTIRPDPYVTGLNKMQRNVRLELYMNIINSASSTIPKDTTIYWSFKPNYAGSFTTNRDTAPGQIVRTLKGTAGIELPQAWYYK